MNTKENLAAKESFINTINKLEQRLLEAQIKGDRAQLEGLLAEEYVGVDPDGNRINKAEEIKNLASSGYTSGEIKDLSVSLHGDTAIATGEISLNKGAETHRYKFTDVYVGEKLVACQAMLA